MSSNAYAKAAARADRPAPDADPREIDAWALGQAAAKLTAAMNVPQNIPALQEAVQTNQRLWTIFQADVSSEACAMPLDVRKNILQLSLYVDRETVQRLADQNASKLRTLIDINVNLAAALRESIRSAGAIRPIEAPEAGLAAGVTVSA